MDNLENLIKKYKQHCTRQKESFLLGVNTKIYFISDDHYKMNDNVYTLDDIERIFKNGKYTTRLMKVLIALMCVLYIYTTRKYNFIIMDIDKLNQIPNIFNTFLHGHIAHFLLNMVAFIGLTHSLRFQISFKFYTFILTVLFIVSIIYVQYRPDSVGFSFELFGLAICEAYIESIIKHTFKPLVLITVSLVVMAIFFNNIDNLGHLVGMLVGLVVTAIILKLKKPPFEYYFKVDRKRY